MVIGQINVVLAASDLEYTKRNELLPIKAKAIYEMGALSYYLTHHATAMDLFEEAAAIYQEIGDETGLAYPNLYVAQTASDMGQVDLARQLWTESLEQFNKSGDHWYAAMIHSFFGAMERRLGNYDVSEHEFHQAIDLYSELGDDWGRSIMFSHLGMVALLRGDPVQARSWFEQRLETAQKIGFKHSSALANLLIGITYWKSGDKALMEKCFLAAIPHFHQIGNYASLADGLIGIAWLAAERGNYEQAAYLLGQVEEINQTYGRKVYFEYDYFNQPLCAEVRSRLGAEYKEAIERGRKADLKEIIKDLVGS
jgi:tetratricopeptide (TPR) repeat protein